MAHLDQVAREHTDLSDLTISHLQRLVGNWQMLADLCFSDLLLFAPVRGGQGKFVVVGQMRPSTSQTIHPEDLLGTMKGEEERPLVFRAWRLGEIVEGDVAIGAHGELVRVQSIPVRYEGKLVGILSRESPGLATRRPGELERVYLEIFERFARMITFGEFPYPIDDSTSEESPRVGDGAILLDAAGRVEYASPNAVNALHRMGVHANLHGQRLEELSVEATAVRAAFVSSRPVTEEIERRANVIVLLRCLPLMDNALVTGAVILLRDVSDIRRRDRLLISKDATIREVHHRVKNNLQTISSLLRLQARRLPGGSSRTAVEEAERRIRSIALVHEILSRDAAQQVPFRDILKPLVRMAEDGVLSDQRVIFTIDGDPGELSADVATPLAVMLTELLVNAVEHGFPPRWKELGREQGEVKVTLNNDGIRLRVRVQDNGVGFPDDLDLAKTGTLGLSIVRDLVRTQLNGDLTLRSEGGAIVELDVPTHVSELTRL